MPRLEPGMARIRVKDLRLRTYIGIKEEEINNKHKQQKELKNWSILSNNSQQPQPQPAAEEKQPDT